MTKYIFSCPIFGQTTQPDIEQTTTRKCVNNNIIEIKLWQKRLCYVKLVGLARVDKDLKLNTELILFASPRLSTLVLPYSQGALVHWPHLYQISVRCFSQAPYIHSPSFPHALAIIGRERKRETREEAYRTSPFHLSHLLWPPGNPSMT